MKNNMYIGKSYLRDGLFMINVLFIILNNSKNKVSFVTYILKSSNLWHHKIRHANLNFACKLMNLSLLSSIHFYANNKCEICVEAKLAKTPFHLVERNTTHLELIHNDIFALNFVQTKGDKKRFHYFYR